MSADQETREWEQVRADAVKALTAAADFSGEGDGMVLGSAVVLADAVLAVVDEEAANRMAQQMIDASRLRSLRAEDGAAVLEAEPAREIVAAWVMASRGLLEGAENYAEISLEFGDRARGERYAFTLQRVGKLTPHEARKAAEAKLAAVRELALALSDRSNEPLDPSLPPGHAGRYSDRRLMEPLRRMLLEILDRP